MIYRVSCFSHLEYIVTLVICSTIWMIFGKVVDNFTDYYK